MATASDPLIVILNGAVQRLLEDVDPSIRKDDENHPSSPEGPEEVKIGFADRLKAIELGVKWVATKNKLDAGDTDDEFGRLRRGTVGGTRGGRRASAAPRPNGHA